MPDQVKIEEAPLLDPVIQAQDEPPIEDALDANEGNDAEAGTIEGTDLAPKPHPLTPGGKRFEQVYAQGKQYKRDFDNERERRIHAEAQLEAVRAQQVPPSQPKEYSWDDLEVMIASGQITRADAQRHREEVITKNLTDKIKGDFQRDIDTNQRMAALGTTMYNYVRSVPDLASQETVIRQRVDKEFDWLVAIQGKSASALSPVERKVLEVNALRNILGPIESLSKRITTTAEPHQGIIGGERPARGTNPDQKLLDGLTTQQIEHYQRMFKSGRYPNKWKDVVDELKYVPPKAKR